MPRTAPSPSGKSRSVPREENCMAFGDGMNDFTMVEAAGLGIAMANAEPEVKRVAKDMVPSNDEDGVARGIEKWIFSR
jgi:hydroxymethylpyrimidine pyrophosphatase-like HAD family hydrolase